MCTMHLGACTIGLSRKPPVWWVSGSRCLFFLRRYIVQTGVSTGLREKPTVPAPPLFSLHDTRNCRSWCSNALRMTTATRMSLRTVATKWPSSENPCFRSIAPSQRPGEWLFVDGGPGGEHQNRGLKILTSEFVFSWGYHAFIFVKTQPGSWWRSYECVCESLTQLSQRHAHFPPPAFPLLSATSSHSMWWCGFPALPVKH